MTTTECTTVKCGLVDKLEKVAEILREMDVQASPSDLIMRNVDEYLLIKEFREIRLDKAKLAAKLALKAANSVTNEKFT